MFEAKIISKEKGKQLLRDFLTESFNRVPFYSTFTLQIFDIVTLE